MNKIATGLAALVGIVVLVVGIPIGLYLTGGAPWPETLPTFNDISRALTSPDDGTAFLAVLKIVGWVAWVSFAAMIVLEVAARLRGVQVPAIPALGLQQKAAAGLVGAAAVLFTVAPLFTAGVAHAAEPTTTTTAVHHLTSGQHTDADAQQHQRAEHRTNYAASGQRQVAEEATEDYVVRSGDSLWSIAEAKLGDGARFAQIARLNYHQPQLDGSTLDSSHWIQPGWILKIPSPETTRAEQQVTVQPGDSLSAIAEDTLGDPDQWPDIYQASQDLAQPDGAYLTDPDLIHPGWTVIVPGTTVKQDQPTNDKQPKTPTRHHGDPTDTAGETPADQGGRDDTGDRDNTGPEETAPEQPTATPGADTGSRDGPTTEVSTVDPGTVDDLTDDDGLPVRTAAGVGSLLAAGVLGLVAVRRTRQRRRHRPGRQVVLPTGETADTEQQLRATADPLSVTTVDIALRTLAAHCTDNDQSLPAVRAGRLTADQFDLYLAEPAQLPPPWEGTADATVWTLPGDAENQLKPDRARDVPSPYPALVTIGHDDEDGHVFLDLEHLGVLGIQGDPEHTRQVLAAIAVELATSQWADDLQVTIVGAYPELGESLETGRVRYLPTPGRLLEELQHRADVDRAQFHSTGAEDLHNARLTNTAPGSWTPEIVLMAGEITDTHRDQLDQLVHQLPRVAIAAVTHGHVVGEWAINLTEPQSATLEPIGLHLRPQLLDDATYAQILTVLATADADLADPDIESSGWTTPEPTLADLPTSAQDDGVGVEFTAVTDPEQDTTTPGDATETPEPDLTVEATGVDELTTAAVEDQPVEISPTPAEHESTGLTGIADDIAADSSDSNSPHGDSAEHESDAPDISDPVAGVLDEGPAIAEPQGAPVTLLPLRGPRILMLGAVEMVGATGTVEPSKRTRLTELAAFLATHPGCDHTLIDEAQWPGTPVSDNSRNTAMSKLRRWMAKTTAGDDFLPRYQSESGYRMHPRVSTDWQEWKLLLPNGPKDATTTAIEEALQLVRGRPFDGARARRYAWAENLRQEMAYAILDASYELARRRLIDGRWRAAGSAALLGLSIEPAYEPLWRVRILAAHASGHPNAVSEAVERLLGVAEDWGGDLEQETEELLTSLNNTPPTREQLTNGLV